MFFSFAENYGIEQLADEIFETHSSKLLIRLFLKQKQQKCKVCSGGRSSVFQHADQHGGTRVCLGVGLTWNVPSYNGFADDTKIRNWGGKWSTIVIFNIDYFEIPNELHNTKKMVIVIERWFLFTQAVFKHCNMNTNRFSATQHDCLLNAQKSSPQPFESQIHRENSWTDIRLWPIMGSSSSAPASGPTKLEDKYYPEPGPVRLTMSTVMNAGICFFHSLMVTSDK